MRSIGIIGAGNLCTNLSRLVCSNHWDRFLMIADKHSPTAERLETDLGNYCVVENDKDTIQSSDVLFLAVEPNNMEEVCEKIKDYALNWSNRKQTIISTAKGISVDSIRKWLDGDFQIARCNINIRGESGSIVWYSEDVQSYDEERKILDMVMAGPTSIWVNDENLIDENLIDTDISTPSYTSTRFETFTN